MFPFDDLWNSCGGPLFAEALGLSQKKERKEKHGHRAKNQAKSQKCQTCHRRTDEFHCARCNAIICGCPHQCQN